ncbi:MAG: tetratricopeptide repeat protein [Sedimentisphaerales bacterium]
MSQTLNKYSLRVLICLVLALATFAVYRQVRNNDFIDFDDDLYVTANDNIQKGPTLETVKWSFTTTHAYNWHPLTWLSHSLDCRCFGLNPAGHHLTSLAFHVANTILLFLVFLQMTGFLWRSAFVAALFALHPLHVESVAWVAERKDVLSTFFWLLTMWLYVRYTKRPGFITYLPIVLAFALGLMAKQMLVTLPFVMLLLDYWPLNRFGRQQGGGKTNNVFRCFIEKIPLLVLSFIAALIVLYVQSKATLVRSALQIPIAPRLANALLAYAEYIIKMFYPLNLGVLYPFPLTNPPLWQVLTAGLLLLCATIAVFRFSRNRRWLIVGWLWYLGTLVPVIGIVQVGLQAMADRYTYVPLIGLFLIIAWGGAELTEKLIYRNVVLSISAVIILISLSVISYRQVSYWKDSITLFKHTAAVTKDNDIMHFNLGRLLLKQGDTGQAIYHWTEAVRIKPDQPTIHRGLAVLFTRQGDINRAIYHYRQVLIYRPDDEFARDNLQKLLAIRENTDSKAQNPAP